MMLYSWVVPTLSFLRFGWSLLSKKQKVQLVVSSCLQILASFIDLFIVLGLAALSAIGFALVTDANLPEQVAKIARVVRLDVQDSASVSILGIVLCIALLFRIVIASILTRSAYGFLAKVAAEISADSLLRLCALDMAEIEKKSTSQYAWMITDGVQMIIVTGLAAVMVVISEVSLLLILSIGLFLTNPKLSIFMFAYFLLLIGVVHRYFAPATLSAQREKSGLIMKSNALIYEQLDAFREITVANANPFFNAAFKSLRNIEANATRRVYFLAVIPKYFIEGAFYLGIGILSTLAFTFAPTESAVSAVCLFIAAGVRMLPSAVRLQSFTQAFKGAIGGSQSTVDFLTNIRGIGTTTEIEASNDFVEENTLNHLIFRPEFQLTNVSFTYPEADHPSLKNISLRILEGQTIGIAGPSGAGKSSLVDLLLGVNHPDSGEISLSGVNPRLAFKTWPGKVAYVPQRISMFNSSLRANVAMNPTEGLIDDARVRSSLEMVGLGSFLESLPNGLETSVGERGVRLSGGQRQRIGIARALYSQPELIILDEATSAVDAEKEAEIQEVMNCLPRNVTRIMIAHRLNTIRTCDNIIYLENGVITAQGTWDELILSSPSFSRNANLIFRK